MNPRDRHHGPEDDDNERESSERGDFEGSSGEGTGKKAGDLLKKVLTVGIGAAFLTEESIRGLVKEMKLPKELIGGLLSTANETKNQFLSKISEDVIARIVDRADPAALVSEFLQKNEVEFTIKVKVKKKGEEE